MDNIVTNEHYNLYYIIQEDKKKHELPSEIIKKRWEGFKFEYYQLPKHDKLLTKHEE